MDFLKAFFPLSFKATEVAKLVIAIIVYLVAGAVISWALSLLSIIPLLGVIIAIFAKLIMALVDIYCLAGIVIAVLCFLKKI